MISRLAVRDAALSLACGLALALSYPRAGIALFAWVAPVPWLALLVTAPPRRGVGLGFVFGLGFFGLLLNWIHGVLAHYTSLPLFLTLPIWILLIGYLASYVALFGWAVSAAARRSPAAALAIAPVLWVGLEFARGRLFGGFPWGTAGYARAAGLPLLQAASVGGVALVSLLLASSWGSLAVLLIAWRGGKYRARVGSAEATTGVPSAKVPRAAVAGAFVVLLVVGATILAGALRLRAHPPLEGQTLFGALASTGGWIPDPAGSGAVESSGAGTPADEGARKARSSGSGSGGAAQPASPDLPLVLALVQGGYGSDFEYEDGPKILGEYLALSRSAGLVASPELIVWPESNAPYQPDLDAAYRRTLSDLSRETGALLLLGGVGGEAKTGLTNSAWLVGPEGILARYDKRRLVQFGEYVPMKRLFPFVRKFVPEAGDFLPGSRAGIVEGAGRRLGIAICYEVIFPEEILEQVREGAEMLVNITNDSWFSGGGPWQHADFVPLRAIESGRWIARAASTGRTLIADPQGRLRAAGALGGAAVLAAAIPAPRSGAARESTFFVRWGEWVGKGCATLAALALAFLFVGNKIDRRRRRG